MGEQRKYLTFEDVTPAGQVTERLDVRSAVSGTTLGTIAWYNPWRRYVFYPSPNTLFDAACLRAIDLRIAQAEAARGLATP